MQYAVIGSLLYIVHVVMLVRLSCQNILNQNSASCQPSSSWHIIAILSICHSSFRRQLCWFDKMHVKRLHQFIRDMQIIYLFFYVRNLQPYHVKCRAKQVSRSLFFLHTVKRYLLCLVHIRLKMESIDLPLHAGIEFLPLFTHTHFHVLCKVLCIFMALTKALFVLQPFAILRIIFFFTISTQFAMRHSLLSAYCVICFWGFFFLSS